MKTSPSETPSSVSSASAAGGRNAGPETRAEGVVALPIPQAARRRKPITKMRCADIVEPPLLQWAMNRREEDRTMSTRRLDSDRVAGSEHEEIARLPSVEGD